MVLYTVMIKKGVTLENEQTLGWVNWGVQPTDSTRHQFWDCPYCGHRAENPCDYLVGFSADKKYWKPRYQGGKLVEYGAVGAVVFQCQACSNYYWHHADKMTLKTYELAIDHCPGDFKVPGALEEFHKMLKKINRRDS